MTELLPAIITRTAVTLGINDLVAGGVSTAEAIAAELGLDSRPCPPGADGYVLPRAPYA